MIEARSIRFDKPFQVSIQTSVCPEPGPQQILIENQYSAVSAGSELLVYRGQVPPAINLDATIQAHQQPIQYPLNFGYASVGYVRALGPKVVPTLLNQAVFSFSPHSTHSLSDARSVIPLGPVSDLSQMALLASMETAVSLVMDAAPIIGEHVAVYGLGTIGCLTAWLLAQYPLHSLRLHDPIESRLALAKSLVGQIEVDLNQSELLDLAIDLSARPETINELMPLLRYDARLILGSWYGTESAPINLGDYFHRNHIHIQSSQVSHIAPHLRGRIDKARRFEIALKQLLHCPGDQIISHRLGIEDAPDCYAQLDRHPENYHQVLFCYKR